jgi:predicted amidohydrolase
MTGRAFTLALIQTNAMAEVADNVAFVTAQVRAAHGDGAAFVLTPETTGLMAPNSAALFERTRPEAEDAVLAAFRALAAELGIVLLIGSLAIKVASDRLANRSFLIGPDGAIQARYDKIHMFDVDLPGGETYRESRNYRPGAQAVLADLPWGRLGMTVCYDLRFPHLYRALAKAGADFLSVPSAFTRQTGEAHWHVLLRARAIETGCFVFAPAQCGRHAKNRETYGHSLVVSPWGEVLADGGAEPGVTLARIEPEAVAEARSRIPAWAGDQLFAPPETVSGAPQDGAALSAAPA